MKTVKVHIGKRVKFTDSQKVNGDSYLGLKIDQIDSFSDLIQECRTKAKKHLKKNYHSSNKSLWNYKNKIIIR